jgi:hypothetical protein
VDIGQEPTQSRLEASSEYWIQGRVWSIHHEPDIESDRTRGAGPASVARTNEPHRKRKNIGGRWKRETSRGAGDGQVLPWILAPMSKIRTQGFLFATGSGIVVLMCPPVLDAPVWVALASRAAQSRRCSHSAQDDGTRPLAATPPIPRLTSAQHRRPMKPPFTRKFTPWAP